ncbi:MAG: hypothetical protein BWX70_02998 [Verrucomicrobia bacterium ADurb.Bin070]|nr:MAG: hypothetical protein BWX70_02998 [Verrucomicrobia bacterium ADurb.Bin070]
MQQTSQPVLGRDRLQDLHDEILVIGRQVRGLENRCDFVLRGRDFVVTGLDRDTQLIQFRVDLRHEGQDTRRNGAEILVLQFLSLGRPRSEQRAPRAQQIRTRVIEAAINQEILLLRTRRCGDHAGIFVPQEPQHALRLAVDGLHRTQQRHLLVQGLTRPGAEGRGDAQGGPVSALHQVSRTRHVPCGVAARFECGADSAARKTGCVGLALDQLLAREIDGEMPFAVRAVEAVMFLCREPGQGIEDVRIVRGAAFNRPAAHRGRHNIRSTRIKRDALFDGFAQRRINVLRQTRLHLVVTKHIDAKVGRHLFAAQFRLVTRAVLNG